MSTCTDTRGRTTGLKDRPIVSLPGPARFLSVAPNTRSHRAAWRRMMSSEVFDERARPHRLPIRRETFGGRSARRSTGPSPTGT